MDASSNAHSVDPSSRPTDKAAALSADRVAILVLGMHRSGTSAVTRLLSLAGAALPEELIEAGEGNSSGHWEPRRLVLHNDDLLKRMGAAWSDWHPLDWSALPDADLPAAREDIATLVAEQFGGADLLVLKDPRICRLTPLYKTALSQAGYRVVVVLPYRNPVEVIDSLMARSNWPADAGRVDAALLWLIHVLEAEHASRGLPRVFVNFAHMLSDWQPLISELEAAGGIHFAAPPEQLTQTATDFLRQGQRHQRRTPEALTRDSVANGWVKEAYNLLEQFRTDPESSAAMARFDALRAALADAMPMLQSLASLWRTTAAELDRAKAESTQALAFMEALRADQAALRADRQGDREEITALRQDNASSRGEIEALRQQADRQARDLDQRAQRIRVLEGELQAAQAAREEELQVARTKHEQDLQAMRTAHERETQAAQAAFQRELHTLRTAQEQDLRAIRKAHQEELQAARSAHEEDLQTLHEIYRRSRSWRVTAPLRAPRAIGAALRQSTVSARILVSYRGGWRSSAVAALAIVKSEGIPGLRMRLKTALSDLRIRHDAQPAADYVNHMASARQEVLLSDWHVRLLRALRDDSPPAADGPTVGLSLVTYNSASWLPGFFASLLSQSFPLSRLNVSIVDHGSSDGTRAALEAHLREHGGRYASFTIHDRPNLGFGAGHDHAIRQLSDPFVLVSNVDLEFHADTIGSALRAALADSDDVGSWEIRQCPYEHPKYYDPVTLEAVWSSHACILLRRAAYLKVGGYDSRIFMYGEDVELSYRLRGSGWRLRYLPQVPVTHHVDLGNPAVRPLQLSGSVAANVLLRHRFGGSSAGEEGETLLAGLLETERDPNRRQALTEAYKTIARNRAHFQNALLPEKKAPFPFSGFDYVIARDGADIPLQSAAPLRKLPLVTVITRTHGLRVAFLREAITSVLNQTYPNIEHIVVEDRTDFAEKLVVEAAKAYGANIRYLKSNGSGRSAAGNFGLAHASGELTMFLDNDDLLFSDHVEILVRALDAQPKLAGAYTLAWDAHTSYDEEAGYREVVHVLPAAHRLDFDRERLKRENFIPIQSMLFRHSLFEQEGGFDDTIDHLEDWHLWARYALYGDFALVRKVTSLYRTPADPEIRASRQADLDAAYEHVKTMIHERARSS